MLQSQLEQLDISHISLFLMQFFSDIGNSSMTVISCLHSKGSAFCKEICYKELFYTVYIVKCHFPVCTPSCIVVHSSMYFRDVHLQLFTKLKTSNWALSPVKSLALLKGPNLYLWASVNGLDPTKSIAALDLVQYIKIPECSFQSC